MKQWFFTVNDCIIDLYEYERYWSEDYKQENRVFCSKNHDNDCICIGTFSDKAQAHNYLESIYERLTEKIHEVKSA